MRILIATIFVVVISNSNSFAKPKWLKLMNGNDPNYFTITKKFDKYWGKRFQPDEEEEEHESKKERREGKEEEDPRPFLVRIFQSEERAKEKSNQFKMEYKNFRKWRMEMLPFVKSDGRIMSEQERLDAWKQLRKFE